MAQLIQAHNDSHIVSAGHAPNAPLIQAAAPQRRQPREPDFLVTGDDPNKRPDDRSVWNPQTNQWERGTTAMANQNARLSDERRGQMAFEADMRRQFSTQNGLGNLSMPAPGDVDAMMSRVVKGARNRAAAAGLPGAPVASLNGKKGSVTFTGGGVPGEAAPVDPMARWIEANAFLRDADGNVKTGWEEQAKWLEGQMQAEWGRKYGFENGASVAKEITGAQGARGNTPRLDEYLQSVGATPQGGETGTTAPATTEAGAPAAALARKGKFRIAKADGSYVIEGEGDTFTETKNGETTTGRLDDLPVGSVQVTQPAPENPVETATPEVVAVPDNAATDTNAGETPKNAPATPEQAATPAQKAQSAKDEYGKLKNKLFPEGSWDATVKRDHEFEKAVRDVKQGSKLDMLLDPANAPDTSKALAERQAEQEEYLASDARWNAGTNREYEKQIAKVQKRIEAATSFANEADNNPSMTTAQRKAAHDKVAEIQKELGDLEAQHLDFLQHIDKDPGWYARGERAKKRSGKDKK